MKIIWTKTDEAPALATRSFLPIIKAFTKTINVDVELRDISLAGRVIATFPEKLNPDQKINDDLSYLGDLVKQSEGNVIKLPNISASIPQLKSCIQELQEKGYDIPDFPEEPKNEEEELIKTRYSTCLGSAVNPVLREGNSDRRAADAVKNFAKMNPHRLKDYNESSRAHVSHMQGDDFYGNEQSVILRNDCQIRLEHHLTNGETRLLNEVDCLKDEIIDASFMSKKALKRFYSQEILDAKDKGLLFSLHLKATMMKVSDPILFGHCVYEYYKDVFNAFSSEFSSLGVNPNLGISDLYKKIDQLPTDKQDEIKSAIKNVYKNNADLAMVDSDLGITNLHAPNDIIIDASIPVVVRDGGQMWNPEGKLQECKAVIPDRSYATMYKEILEDCIKNGQFNVETMGNVSNVGLMAQKAEEYGSHPTTFEISEDGVIKIVDDVNNVLIEHTVEKGDIWRMSRTKDIPIHNWVKLAYERAKLTGFPVVFWLDEQRAHDANIIKKVNEYLPLFNTNNDIEYHILSPKNAMHFTLEKVRKGLNVISATGNVLRDYLTDLFPILELGTSAKMLSIVPLIAGGRLFETGAGGSAPKHVQQFVKEGHLRWDSLGEFLALAESLRFLEQKTNDKTLGIFTNALDTANALYLENRKSPSRKANEKGNTVGHYFVTQYWARALADQTEDKTLANVFTPVADSLEKNESIILEELLSLDGNSQDIDGYYLPNDEITNSLMRPSITLNKIINGL